MQPSSFPSSAKLSWKAKMSSLAAATFLGVQLLRPSKFSFSRSFYCQAATVIGSRAVSAPRPASILGDSSTEETCKADTMHTTLTPFFRKMGLSNIFLTTMDTLLLLIFSWVYVCLVEEAAHHLAELHKLSGVLPSCEHFPLVRV